jgi:hypothetical protein
LHRVGHEIDDELSQRNFEPPILERERLRGTSLHADAGMTAPNGLDELLGWIDGPDGGRSQPPDQLAGQRAGAAADIEHPLTGAETTATLLVILGCGGPGETVGDRGRESTDAVRPLLGVIRVELGDRQTRESWGGKEVIEGS